MAIRSHRVDNRYVETADRLIVTDKATAHGASKTTTDAKVSSTPPPSGEHRRN